MNELSVWSDATQALPMPLPASFEWKIRHLPVKRLFDIVFSSIILIIGSPILLIIALAIKFSSKGNIIYSHTRVGRGGKIFKFYKFRTMYEDAEEKLNDLLGNNPKLKNEWEQSYKLKIDPRITPIGRFLRKTSLDELPQFWNVLKGDLSVVGPRPVVQTEIQKYFGIKAYKILSIRPGLTGLWQVSGRSNTSYETRVKLDEEYADRHSLLLDLKIIVKTVPVMLFSRGAY